METKTESIPVPRRADVPMSLQWILSIGLCLFVLGYVLFSQIFNGHIKTWGLNGYVVTLLMACLLVALLQWRFQEHRRRACLTLQSIAIKQGGKLTLCSYCGRILYKSQWMHPKLFGLAVDRAGVPLKYSICEECEPRMISALEHGEFFPEKYTDQN